MKSTKTIPFTTEQLSWHLHNNVMGLTDYTIENIIKTINRVKIGKLKLSDDPMIGCTVAEMLEDLRIDYNMPNAFPSFGRQSIYQRATRNGCQFVGSCVDIGIDKWDELMKGARHANQRKVVRAALLAGIIDQEQAKTEIKRPYFNPYNHFVTRTHIVYVHSGIEYFIKVN